MGCYYTKRPRDHGFYPSFPLQFRDIHRQQGNTHHHHRHNNHRRHSSAADSPLGLVKSEEAPAVGVASEDEDEGETHHQTVSGQQLEIAQQESRSGKTTDVTQ